MENLSILLGNNVADVKFKGGQSLKLHPLTLGDIADAEEKFGCELATLGDALKKMKNILFFIFLSMRRSSPGLTVNQVGDLFGIKDMVELQKVVETILTLSGLQAEEPKNEAGTPA